jgi:dihydrofolate reductase
MRNLVEITFMSLDGTIDSPEIVQEARRYFEANEEHYGYQMKRLLAADALLLGRKTYQALSQAYPAMAKAGVGAPTEFVNRMNSIKKYVASKTLKETTWNATILSGDIAGEVRKLKNQPGKALIKYGTGSLDRTLLGEDLVDVLCIVVYPFVIGGGGTHLFEGVGLTAHLRLLDVKRFANGTVVLEYAR